MNQDAEVKIGTETTIGTVKKILPTGVQLEYRGQIFAASFATMENLVAEKKAKTC